MNELGTTRLDTRNSTRRKEYDKGRERRFKEVRA